MMQIDTSAKSNLFRKSLEQFVTFNEAEWALFRQHLSFSTLKKKDHFAAEGKVCDYIGFILTGAVRYYHIKDGTDLTGYFSFENEFVSSYKSFLTREPAANYIQALEDTEMVLISHQHLHQMLADPLLAFKTEHFGRVMAEHYLCCYEDRITSFITQSPEERYLKMMETEKEVFQRIPQHYIANFLGITPVSLSRIRKRVLHLA
jgi:CRP-like cAMP-binding protein